MENEELKPVDTMSPAEAGKLLRMNAGTVRAGLRQGRLPFGTAIQGKTGQWIYNIIKSKVLNYANVVQKNNDKEVKTNVKKTYERI